MFLFQNLSFAKKQDDLQRSQTQAIIILDQAKTILTPEQYNETKTRVNNAKNSQEVANALQELGKKNKNFQPYLNDFLRWYKEMLQMQNKPLVALPAAGGMRDQNLVNAFMAAPGEITRKEKDKAKKIAAEMAKRNEN